MMSRRNGDRPVPCRTAGGDGFVDVVPCGSWDVVFIRRIYVDPDVGDAGMANSGGETPPARMIRGSMGPERFSPSADDAGGTIYLGRRRQLRHHRRFRGG